MQKSIGIGIENFKKVINENQLMLSHLVRDYYVDVTVQHSTDSIYGAWDTTHSHPGAGGNVIPINHEHEYKGRKKIMMHYSLRKGEILGIVGFNGSGKSTILKVVAGVLEPTSGSIEVIGKVAPLIELGAGFDPDLTARENIFLNGAVLGYDKKFMEEKFDEIVDFSELGEFLDTPLKNFSSGMYARLGFAIATVVRPDILIADEILAVGDFPFQEKCERKIKEMMAQGTSILFVSHSIEQVEQLCDRVVWLEKGKLRMVGETLEVCEAYRNS